MKKLFIGLLVVAAGAGAFFYFKNKKQPSTEPVIQKELIVGNWKMDSVQTGKDSTASFLVGIMGIVDSNLLKYRYEFTKEGSIRRSIGDSLTKDNSRYIWNKKDQLVWKEDDKDSVGTVLQVAKLSKDSLTLQSPDSTIILFTKLK